MTEVPNSAGWGESPRKSKPQPFVFLARVHIQSKPEPRPKPRRTEAPSNASTSTACTKSIKTPLWLSSSSPAVVHGVVLPQPVLVSIRVAEIRRVSGFENVEGESMRGQGDRLVHRASHTRGAHSGDHATFRYPYGPARLYARVPHKQPRPPKIKQK